MSEYVLGEFIEKCLTTLDERNSEGILHSEVVAADLQCAFAELKRTRYHLAAIAEKDAEIAKLRELVWKILHCPLCDYGPSPVSCHVITCRVHNGVKGLEESEKHIRQKIEVIVPGSVDPQSIACGINRQYGDHGVVARTVLGPASPKIAESGENGVYECHKHAENFFLQKFKEETARASALKANLDLAQKEAILQAENAEKWKVERDDAEKFLEARRIDNIRLCRENAALEEKVKKLNAGLDRMDLERSIARHTLHALEAKQPKRDKSGKFTAREENSVFVSPAEMHQMTDQEKREYVELFNTIPATELGIILDM